MAGVQKIDKGIIIPKVLNLLFCVLVNHRLTFLYFAVPRRENPRRRKYKLETVEDKRLSRCRRLWGDRMDPRSQYYGDEIERFAKRCLKTFGEGKGSPPMKKTKTGFMQIEGSSYPFWEISENAVKYLEKTSTEILQACQYVIEVDKQGEFTSLVNDAKEISRDRRQDKWDPRVRVPWEYLAELDFVILLVKKARMRAHLGFFEATSEDNLSLADASRNTLTSDRVREILEKAVPLASTLPELSNLIRGFNRSVQAGLSSEEIKSVMTKTITSADQLRYEIGFIIGTEQAARFYDELRSALNIIASCSPLVSLIGWEGTAKFRSRLTRQPLYIDEGSRVCKDKDPIETLAERLDQWQDKKPIEIRADKFSVNSKSFKLLARIAIGDTQREGVEATKADVKSLKDLLGKHGYTRVIRTLEHRKGKLRTTIQPGQIAIIPRKSKK